MRDLVGNKSGAQSKQSTYKKQGSSLLSSQQLPSLSKSKSKTLTRNWELSTGENNIFNPQMSVASEKQKFFNRRMAKTSKRKQRSGNFEIEYHSTLGLLQPSFEQIE